LARVSKPEIDEEHPPTPRRLEAMRARFFGSKSTTKPCQCGCGLVFRVAAGRRYHPQCPTRPGERDRHGRLLKDGRLKYSLTKQRRCEMCEDLPHRRARPKCPCCDEPFGPDVMERVDGRPGCALGSVE
jgi:hypothetical protein